MRFIKRLIKGRTTNNKRCSIVKSNLCHILSGDSHFRKPTSANETIFPQCSSLLCANIKILRHRIHTAWLGLRRTLLLPADPASALLQRQSVERGRERRWIRAWICSSRCSGKDLAWITRHLLLLLPESNEQQEVSLCLLFLVRERQSQRLWPADEPYAWAQGGQKHISLTQLTVFRELS